MKQHVITTEAMQGLDGAIGKWQGLVDDPELIERIRNFMEIEPECPLCNLYDEPDDDVSGDCEDCPIFADTGKDKCYGTPWDRWFKDETVETGTAMLNYLIDLKSRCTVEKGESQ